MNCPRGREWASRGFWGGPCSTSHGSRRGGLGGLGKGAASAHYLGSPRPRGPLRHAQRSSFLLAPVRPQAPSSAVLRGEPSWPPPVGFLGRILLGGCFSWMEPLRDPSSPPQVPIKCSKYFLLLNKANKGEGSPEA